MRFIDSFKPEGYYHIYNHANGDENLFRSEANYYYFLKKFTHYILPIAKTYSYCLLPNHFHFFVQFRPEEEITEHIIKLNEGVVPEKIDFHKFLMQQFSNLLNSYTKSINKVYGRRGALFLDYTRRVEITHPQYFKNLVCYIHNNPVRHGLCLHPNEWKFSSYLSLNSMNAASKLERTTILEWFNGEKSIEMYHLNKENFIPEIYLID